MQPVTQQNQPIEQPEPIAPPHERLFREMTPEAYQTWRHNPITAAYLLFLRDLKEAFQQAAVDRWVGGNLHLEDDDPNAATLRGQIIALTDLCELQLGDIHSFYRHEVTQVENGKDEQAAAQGRAETGSKRADERTPAQARTRAIRTSIARRRTASGNNAGR